MKKKRVAKIVIILILVVLLFPIRMNLKDGGSVRYKSLVYEVTKIHQLAPELEEERVKPYIDGFEIKIFGMTVYRETDEYNHKEPYVVNTYYATSDTEVTHENDEFVILVKHYEMSDGTWKTDDYTYQYKLEIFGRMPNAVKDSTFVFLSNIEEISFQKAMMASGLSSNMEDYFDEETAKFIGMK